MMNNDYIEKINNKLNEYLKPVYPNEIYNAMAYSVNAGGKRLRPIILIAACEALGGCIDEALPFACSIEMIHTYSLIHDDLPALDNDELRRGKPTCHMQFDEAIAILAGDSLLNMAYEIMSSEALKAMDKKFLKAMSFIAQAAGTKGKGDREGQGVPHGAVRGPARCPHRPGGIRGDAAKVRRAHRAGGGGKEDDGASPFG